MQDFTTSFVTIDEIKFPDVEEKKVSLSVLRLDKIHPLISGNKWFKLRFYLEEARRADKTSIATFGGAWSNHLLATAAICNKMGLKSTGIVRGEEPEDLSSTLHDAEQLGMQLLFINREDYRDKKIPLILKEEDFYIIPEGGYGITGVQGAATITELYNSDSFSHTCCAAGTGTMTAGLLKGTRTANEIISISVLKNNLALEENIANILPGEKKKATIIHDYHCGGYAKHTPELISFMNTLYKQVNIQTDFVYTGKLFYAVHDLIKKDFFPGGSRLLLVHSGGLQGNNSLSKGTLIF